MLDSSSLLARGLVLHGVKRAHTAVLLESLALAVEELARSFAGTGKQAAHHNGRGTEGSGLGDVADVGDTTVSPDGNPELVGKLGNGVDGRSLRTTNSSDLLGNADGARAHANTEGVSASSDELSGLLAGDNIACNDLETREVGLDPLDHLNLEAAVALGGVKDNDVETGVDEELQALSVRLAGADGGSNNELLRVGLLASQRVVLVLKQIGSSEQGLEAALVVNDGKLALLGVAKDGVGFFKVDADLANNELGSLGHDALERSGGRAELDIAASNNALQLAVELASVC